jgi:hypothetical protein
MKWTEDEKNAVRRGIKAGIVSRKAWCKIFPYRTIDSIYNVVVRIRTEEGITAKKPKREIDWSLIEVKEEEQCELEKDRSSATPIRAVSLD